MSLFDHPEGVQPAPTWRCPACRTLQPQTTHCWRCHTAAFTCESCAFYRASVAAGLGSCGADPSRPPLRADETHACWESPGTAGPVASAGSTLAQAPGLFAEAEIAASAAVASAAPVPLRSSGPAAPDRRRRRSRPPLETPGRAAWVEPESDALVDAPMVEPGKRLGTEVARRRRRWFR